MNYSETKVKKATSKSKNFIIIKCMQEMLGLEIDRVSLQYVWGA